MIISTKTSIKDVTIVVFIIGICILLRAIAGFNWNVFSVKSIFFLILLNPASVALSESVENLTRYAINSATRDPLKKYNGSSNKND